MKLKIGLSIVLLLPVLPVSVAYADTPVAKDSEQVCENRIKAFKSSLEASIAADKTNVQANANKKNVDEAKAELSRINQLPNTLTPCEKQRQIPALANGGALKTKQDEAVKDSK